MGAVDDPPKLLQDLVTPEFKELKGTVKANEEASKLRDEALPPRSTVSVYGFRPWSELLYNRMEANHASVVSSLDIDKRVEAIERKAAGSN